MNASVVTYFVRTVALSMDYFTKLSVADNIVPNGKMIDNDELEIIWTQELMF
jgi:hypothetical protein